MARLQLNLLPDIKMQANKQEKVRNRLVGVAVMVSLVCFGVFVLMALTVYGLQKKQLSDSNKQIETASAELQKIPNLNKVLTVRNQLGQLVNLHQSKHTISRLFSYLKQVTPQDVSINQVALDTATNSIRLTGTAASPHAVNVFIDTLKYSQFRMGKSGSLQSAFIGVVENSFGLSDNGVNFSLTFKFDPQLFAGYRVDSQGKVVTPILVVPNKATSRSVSDDLGNLFNSQPKAP